jgi:PTS system lactose-specific IIC component
MYYKKEMQGSIKDEEFVDFRPGYVYIKNFFLDKAKHNEIKLKLKDQKDALINAEELANMKVVLDTEKTATPPSESKISKKVLVVCIGAGTSAMVAENINKVFENNSKYKIKGAACSQGNYSEFISTTDLVIISPQAKTIEKDLRAIEQSRNDFHV